MGAALPTTVDACALDSIVRTEVVPTAITLPPACLVLLISSAVSEVTSHHSVWILCSSGSASVTGEKVSSPTCNVTLPNLTPYCSSDCINAGVKCSPAVGAAALPACLE